MRIKASDLGEWLRRRASTRDHRQVTLDDGSCAMLRPGPNFDLLLGLLGNSTPAQTPSPSPAQNPKSDDRREIDDHAQ